MEQASLLCMDNRTWYARISTFVEEACDASPQDEGAIMRAMLVVLSTAPHGQRARFADLPSRERLDILLMAGAGESAALAMLPANAAYIVSRGGNGVNLASVLLDGDDQEMAAEAATAGLALLAAFAGALRFAAPMPVPVGELAVPAAAMRSGCLH